MQLKWERTRFVNKIITLLLSLSVPQRRVATELGVLPPDYQENSAGNGLPRQ